MPITGSKDDGYDASSGFVVTFHGPRHLDVIAVIGCQEISAYKEKDDFRRIQLSTDLTMDVLARPDAPVVPGANYSLAAERREMLLQLVSKVLIRV